MNPWAIIGAALLWALSLAGTAHFMYDAGKNAEIASKAREDKASAAAADAAASAAASAISRISVTHRTIRQELEREIVEKPVYRDPDCRTGPASLQRFNAGIPDAPAPAASDPG